MKKWIAAGLATVALGGWLIFFVFDGNAVLDYGQPGDVYIRPPEVESGEEASVCFKKITWLRLCPTTLTERIKIDGYNFEIGAVHQVHVPTTVGPIEPKCRGLSIPQLPRDLTGEATYSAVVESHCGPIGYKIIQTIKGVKFTVK